MSQLQRVKSRGPAGFFEIDERFDALQKLLEKYRQGDGFAEKKEEPASIDALLDKLARTCASYLEAPVSGGLFRSL